MPQIISFATHVSAITHAEFVTMQGTNHIALHVYPSLCKYRAGMRACVGKGKELILVSSNTNDLSFYFSYGNIVIPEMEFRLGFCNLIPVIIFQSGKDKGWDARRKAPGVQDTGTTGKAQKTVNLKL